jgi:hypothetical protein
MIADRRGCSQEMQHKQSDNPALSQEFASIFTNVILSPFYIVFFQKSGRLYGSGDEYLAF